MVKGHKNRQLDNVIKSRAIADDAITNAELGSLQEKTLLFEYDFAVSGGAASTITLTGKDNASASSIPDNAVITNVTIEGVTDNLNPATGATIALGYTGETAAFLAATAFDNAMWDANAVTSGGPVVAKGKTTSEVAVTATIATSALTAGKWYVWVTYFEGA